MRLCLMFKAATSAEFSGACKEGGHSLRLLKRHEWLGRSFVHRSRFTLAKRHLVQTLQELTAAFFSVVTSSSH